MKIGFRIFRAIIFLVPALFVFIAGMGLSGLTITFGITLVTAALATIFYIFIYLDKNLNEKIFMEGLTDLFFGIVLFSYPDPDKQFFIVIFSSWLFIMSLLTLSGGIAKKQNKKYLWIYLLSGIFYLIISFVIINYVPDAFSSINYTMAIVLIVYSILTFYLILSRKEDIY